MQPAGSAQALPPTPPHDLHSVLHPSTLSSLHWPNAYRKRQRSPCELRMDVPLSDPDIDCERGHSQQQKRYLSEIMATGLSLQMSFADADMDKGPDEAADTDAAARATGFYSSLSSAAPAHTLLEGNSPVMGLTRPSALDAAPGTSMQQHSRSQSPPSCGNQGSSIPSLSVPILSIPSRTARPDSRANPMLSPRGSCAMRSPEPSPASPTDGRFPLDLRKTALLRSLLIRTDESSGAAPSPEPDPSCMVAVVVPGEGDMAWQMALPSPHELFMAKAPDPEPVAAEAAAPPPPPTITRGGLGGRQAAPPVQIRPIPMTAMTSSMHACHFDPAGPAAATLTAPRGAASHHFSLIRLGSAALPLPCSESLMRPASSMTLSRSESCIDDTANSMDTSSTTSSMQEEQSRRMSMQGLNSLNIPSTFMGMGGDGGASTAGFPAGLPPRYRGPAALNMAAAQSRSRQSAADAQSLPEGPGMRAGFGAAEEAAMLELRETSRTLLFGPPADVPPPAMDVHPIAHEPLANLMPFAQGQTAGFAGGSVASAPAATSAPPASAQLPGAILQAAGSPASPPALPPSPSFEERLLQLRTRALAESAKLVGDLEDLGQYRSIAPQLVAGPRHGAGGGVPGAGSLSQAAAQRSGVGGSGLGFGGPMGTQPKLAGRRYRSDEGGADRDEGEGVTGQEHHMGRWGLDT